MDPDGLAPNPADGSHYDLSNDFYASFLDPSMTYSCAYFASGEESLEEAQMAKNDLAFRKLGLGRGQRILDVGCGWGAAAARAVELYGARAVGLTLSRNQYEYAVRRIRPGMDLEYRLQGWETYQAPFERIVSIGAFEHFTAPKYPAFFSRCHEMLTDDGLLLLHTITVGKPSRSFALLRFGYFVRSEIFAGGELPRPEQVLGEARLAGFELLHAESLRPHYGRTIDLWLANLEARREQAVQAVGPAVLARFLLYLQGAQRYHAGGETDVYQFLFRRT